MFDNRFPLLERFSAYKGASSHARRCVAEVERRTGTNAIINTRGGRVTFRYGENLGGPMGAQLDTISRWSGGDVDDIVRLIQMGKMSRANKDAIDKDNKAREASEKRSHEERVFDHATPAALDYVAHNDRARRGVQKVTA